MDVGRGQIHEKLRSDPRVDLRERVNVRHLEAVDVPGSIDLIVADVSFISLRLLLPAFVRVAPHARWLLLVKPQFEVGKEKVGKGGVVREDHLREEAVTSVLESASTHGYALEKRADSRISGPSGNREIFVLLTRRPAENSPHAPA
jgi:23S rRNA (cytidine1920-2'-O)/16S rRNA (cytidine1409-2'-O)-methyltransferase